VKEGVLNLEFMKNLEGVGKFGREKNYIFFFFLAKVKLNKI
jgi:hypothetical protein